MTWAESWLHQPSLLICESLIVIPLSIYATLNSESDPLFFFFHNGVGKWYSDKQCGLIFLLDSAHQGSRQSTSKYRKQLISVISAKMKIKWDEGISWNGWGRSLKSLSRGLNDEKWDNWGKHWSRRNSRCSSPEIGPKPVYMRNLPEPVCGWSRLSKGDSGRGEWDLAFSLVRWSHEVLNRGGMQWDSGVNRLNGGQSRSKETGRRLMLGPDKS